MGKLKQRPADDSHILKHGERTVKCVLCGEQGRGLQAPCPVDEQLRDLEKQLEQEATQDD